MKQLNDELEKFFSYRLINVLYIAGISFSFLIIFIATYFVAPKELVDVKKSYIMCSYPKKLSFLEAKIYESSYEKYPWQFNPKKLYISDQVLAEGECFLAIRSMLGSLEKIPTLDEIKVYFPEYIDVSDRELLEGINRATHINVSKECTTPSKKKGWIIVNTMCISNYLPTVDHSTASSYESNAADIQNIKFYYHTSEGWNTPVEILIFGSLMAYSALNIVKEMLIYIFIGRKFTWNWLKFRKITIRKK